MNQVLINDTTLRDGEQAAGVAFTLEEKVVMPLATIFDGIAKFLYHFPKTLLHIDYLYKPGTAMSVGMYMYHY